MNSTVQLTPTYHGFIASTYDALILFEGCLSGQINHVARRPHDREREHVIKSGNIFIYEEHSSGIKRWTDGVSWSPSRILGNFLIYRQLVKPFGPGEKKKALKKSKGPNGGIMKSAHTTANNRTKANVHQMFGNQNPASYSPSGQVNLDVERSLIGSLVDSYDFMDDGLVKKTISVSIGEVTHHLVSYYTMADAMVQNKFNVPSRDPRFQNLQIRAALTTKQNFRTPIEDVDPMDRAAYGRNYSMTNQSIVQNTMPYPTGPEIHPAYHAASMYHGGYGGQPVTGAYETGIPAYAANGAYGNGGNYGPPGAPGMYPTSRVEQYPPQGDYRQRYSIVSNVSNVSNSSSDGSRAQMPPAGRRMSNFQSNYSDDSGIGMNMETRPPSNEPPHSANSSGSYYNNGTSRDSGLATNNVPISKGLPSLENRQAMYERPASTSAHYRLPLDGKDAAIWAMNGNASVGHAHYNQAQWASATH